MQLNMRFKLYNATLNTNAIGKFYLEEIGGAPFGLQNHVGWWPLNGDVLDYS